MKKLLITALLITSFNVNADGGWVAPLIGGIAIGAMAGSVYSAPRYVEVHPPVAYPSYPHGYGYDYRYESVFDPNCYCYRTMLVPIR